MSIFHNINISDPQEIEYTMKRLNGNVFLITQLTADRKAVQEITTKDLKNKIDT